MQLFPLHVDEEHVRVTHAVARLVAEGGLEAVTIRSTAAAARLAVGTLMHRMGCKDELLGAVARTASLGLSLGARGSTPLESLVAADDAESVLYDRLYLALRELARSRPEVATGLAFRDRVEDHHLRQAGVPEHHLRGMRALVVGLRDAVADPLDPMPRGQALLVLQVWTDLLVASEQPAGPGPTG